MWGDVMNKSSIANIHTLSSVCAMLLFLPFSSVLSKLAMLTVPNSAEEAQEMSMPVLDERLFATPAIALVKSEELTKRMAADAELALHESLQAVLHFTPELAASVRRREDDTDRYEDTLGTFLVHLATQPMSE